MTGDILVVDDSLTVRMNLVEVLEAAGFETASCATVAAARTALAGGSFGLVLLDVILPDGDGIAFLREIREAATGSPAAVILLSSETEVHDRIRGLTTGADEYIGKPYEPSYVVARARELLRSRATSAAPAQPTVLIIDDSITFREALKQVLEKESYRVLLSGSGEDGLRMAAESRPAAMIVDGVLPGIDGRTVIRRLRLDAALRRTPCLLLTASEDKGVEVRSLDAGADAFVRKDEDMAVILARLHAALRSAEDSAGEQSTASLLAPKKILAVDENEGDLTKLSAALRAEGYDVALARDGEAAIELLAIEAADCILIGVPLPGIGGYETCQRIKAAPMMRQIPIIILTGQENREEMVRALDAGADDYISKSRDFEVLRARILAQMRRKQFEDENRSIHERLLRKEMEAREARAAQQLAETRAALVEELERMNKELEAFSYSVSHDLRAPLRSIDGFSQALLEDCADALDERGLDHLRRVRSAVQRMGDIIEDLLQLSKVGRASVRRERVDLSALASRVADALKQAAPERTTRVVIQEALVADADAGLMRVLFENLLGNAWKFTQPVVDATIAFGAAVMDGNLIYFVHDSGVGFNMAYADKLFAPFQRLHSEAEFPGTGIGLATVQRVVERHGGRIWAESSVGKGATFHWTLPAQRLGGGI